MHLERGIRLLREGAYFEAHEELELAWRAAAPAERDFYQGLVHVAVLAAIFGLGVVWANRTVERRLVRG